MRSLVQDVRDAIRGLRHAPGYTLVAVLTLGIGIGAVTTLFNVIDGVVLRPLRYPDAGRLVSVHVRFSDRTMPTVPGGDAIDIAAEPDVFDAVAYYHGGEMGVQLGDRAEFVGVRLVHPDFFRVFAVPPAAGRPFNRDDAGRSAIVSAGFAERNFGGAALALSRSVFIENRSYGIVGVMPGVMQFPAGTDVWAAGPLEPANRNRTGHNYRLVAKLPADASVETANDRLSALAARLAEAFPASNAGKTFTALALRDDLVGPVRGTLYILLAAVVLLLLIACANVANLTLARGAVRARDVAVRVALGASRRRILSLLLLESAIVASLASGLGVSIAVGGTHLLTRVGARYVPLPRLSDIAMDWRVLVFGAGLSLLTVALFGLAPAVQTSSVSPRDSLTQRARGAVGGRSARLRNALVVAQIALSSTLAIDAALLFRSFVSLTEAPLGFDRDGVLVMYAHAPARGSIFDGSGLDAYLRIGRLFDDISGRVRALPNVTAAGAAMGLPTGQYSSNGAFAVEGRHTFDGDLRRLPSAGLRLASPGYFATLGMPILRGRDFEDGDIYERPFVAIVSQSLARQIFGDEDPLGHRIACGLDQPDRWMTIVGVVGDVRQSSPAAQPGPEIYMPLRQHPYLGNEVQVVVRARVPPESLIAAVQQTVRAASPDIAMKFTTLDASVSRSIAAPRFRATLVSAFAALALLLALAGSYAVMSYVTAQRTAEFGLRMALGASARDVARLVLVRASTLTIAGIVIGAALSLATSRAIATMLFGITTTDVPTYLAVLPIAMLLVIASAAIPAFRAARVDPMVSLRAE